MRLMILTVLTLIAFAANSVLTRAALQVDAIDPSAFAVIRVASGAVMLLLIATVRSAAVPMRGEGRLVGVASLVVYLIGFSLAYLTLDAGLGALILFAMVQVTMMVASAVSGTRLTLPQIAGIAIALAGLCIVLWPVGPFAVDPVGAVLMAVAGIGWGIYTLAGRTGGDPLAVTTANFVWAVPVAAVLLLSQFTHVTWYGAGLAVVCGAVTSGLGYALWYTVLPSLAAVTAGLLQLAVPIIAIAAGVLLLGEPLTSRLIIASVMVVFGIALGVLSRKPGA
jgi:drug/metabolite transporter (DMT)-like permease